MKQKVWIAGPCGGKEVCLDNLFPKGKVSIWAKIFVLAVLLSFLALFVLILFFS